MSTVPDAAPMPPGPAHKSRGGIRSVIIFVVLFGALLLIGLLPRLKQGPQLIAEAKAAKNAAPIVNVTQPTRAPQVTILDLPGTIQGAEEAQINARASGYLRKWYVDIGDRVRAGQTLALIETPDIDQQVAQARAQVTGSDASVQQARANYQMMRANTDQARANLSRAQASLQQAKTDLSKAKAAKAQTVEAEAQQRAQLLSAQTSANLAKVTASRYEYLVAQGAVAQEIADQQVAAYKNSVANVQALEAAVRASAANISAAQQSILSAAANVKAFADGVRASRAAVSSAQANANAALASVNAARANTTSNKANLQRTAVLQGFQKVVAPFAGIVTARSAEVGSLVSATGGVSATQANGSTNTASSLFTISRVDSVRVFVDVPQTLSGTVKTGQTVQVYVAELGNKPVTGRINRNATGLDPTTRTLQTQVDIPNADGRLRPGSFATVHIELPQPSDTFRIPDTSLITDSEGIRVATVTSDNKVHFKTIVVGRDYGKELDVTSGLQGDESLIANPTPALIEGQTVQPQAAPSPNAPGGGTSGGGNGSQQGQRQGQTGAAGQTGQGQSR